MIVKIVGNETCIPTTGITEALQLVANERDRQEGLVLTGKFHWTCAEPRRRLGTAFYPSDEAKLAVLTEEVGELAHLVTEALIDEKRRYPSAMREELIQIAAVAVAWVEALDVELGR